MAPAEGGDGAGDETLADGVGTGGSEPAGFWDGDVVGAISEGVGAGGGDVGLGRTVAWAVGVGMAAATTITVPRISSGWISQK